MPPFKFLSILANLVVLKNIEMRRTKEDNGKPKFTSHSSLDRQRSERYFSYPPNRVPPSPPPLLNGNLDSKDVCCRGRMTNSGYNSKNKLSATAGNGGSGGGDGGYGSVSIPTTYSINERAESLKSKEAVITSMNSAPSAWVSASVEHPKKRALLCAVSYKQWKYRLKGTLNDVTNFRALLINTFGFPPENVLVLTEEEKDQNLIPTKYNIIRALQWLGKDCESGDSLVFYFSGYGLRQPDFSDDELDGFDETICPVDFMKEGMILDNDINSLIVLPLKKGVTLHAIVDACHSGTILDLEYVYDKEKNDWKDNRPPSGKNKKPSGGLAISISACDDAEFASDTSAFTGNTMNGAMTYLLIDAITSSISNNMKVTYGDLIDKIYDKIEETSRKGCFANAKVLRGLIIKKTVQKPQLSSSERFDVYHKTFEL